MSEYYISLQGWLPGKHDIVFANYMQGIKLVLSVGFLCMSSWKNAWTAADSINEWSVDRAHE